MNDPAGSSAGIKKFPYELKYSQFPLLLLQNRSENYILHVFIYNSLLKKRTTCNKIELGYVEDL